MSLVFSRLTMMGVLLLASSVGVVSAQSTDTIRPTRGIHKIGRNAGPLSTEITQIQSIQELAAGNYIANAVATAASNDPQFHNVVCFFTVGGSFKGTSVQGSLGGGINNFVAIPLTIGFVLETPKSLGVACSTDVENIVVYQPTAISVISVDKIRGAVVIP